MIGHFRLRSCFKLFSSLPRNSVPVRQSKIVTISFFSNGNIESVVGLNIFYFREIGLGKAKLRHKPYPHTTLAHSLCQSLYVIHSDYHIIVYQFNIIQLQQQLHRLNNKAIRLLNIVFNKSKNLSIFVNGQFITSLQQKTCCYGNITRNSINIIKQVLPLYT